MSDLPEEISAAANRAQVRFAFTAAILSMFVGALLGIFITLALAGPLQPGDDLPRWTILVSEAFIVVPLLIMLRNRRMPLIATFRLGNVAPIIWRDALIIAVGVAVLVDELDRLVTMVFPLPEGLQSGLSFLTFSTPFEALLVIGGAAVVAPIAEEMIFRGFFQGQLEAGYGDATRAVVYSSMLFMVLHFNPWWALQIYLLGMVLGYLTWRTGSIWPAVVLHALNNLLAVLLASSGEGEPAWYAVGGHVSVLWILVAAIMTYAGFHSLIANTQKDHQLPEGGAVA